MTDDFDTLTRELGFESKAKATDRIKTEEEVASEEAQMRVRVRVRVKTEEEVASDEASSGSVSLLHAGCGFILGLESSHGAGKSIRVRLVPKAGP